MAKLIIEDYLKKWQENDKMVYNLRSLAETNKEIKEKYESARMMADMINSYLAILDETERIIIEEFYYKKEKADYICNKLNIGRTSFFRKKKNILKFYYTLTCFLTNNLLFNLFCFCFFKSTN